ncbi:autophagy protein 16-domain-containing protein [Lipomyces doorenjongii]|uniref:autophagy protein 16-domain-containing protein n=1 Tax=Lipomyces doorenjongii TaxID=383834 RepID=UPI0034CEFEED
MAADWRSTMVKSIEMERDVREMKNYYIIDAYTKLAERTVAAETNTVGSTTGAGTNSRDLARIRVELESLYNNQSTSKSIIENLEAEAEKLKLYNARIDAEFEKLQLDKKKLESRLKTRDEEYRERNKSIQILQDEILTYQIQLNVAEDKVNKLEKENRELVNRWMERVSREAEKLNDANAFLERLFIIQILLLCFDKYKLILTFLQQHRQKSSAESRGQSRTQTRSNHFGCIASR